MVIRGGVRLGRPAGLVAAMVIGVVIRDARAVVAALADPETLYVFGVIAARTSKLGERESDRVRSTPYVTPFGLMRETSLSRDAGRGRGGASEAGRPARGARQRRAGE